MGALFLHCLLYSYFALLGKESYGRSFLFRFLHFPTNHYRRFKEIYLGFSFVCVPSWVGKRFPARSSPVAVGHWMPIDIDAVVLIQSEAPSGNHLHGLGKDLPVTHLLETLLMCLRNLG